MLAQAIAERCGRERIYEVFLSPDAFARRTSEASVAEQLSSVLVVNGLPRPSPADDDRVGGWQWMYSLLQSNSWLMTDNCSELIQCLPHLVRDPARDADVRKVDGDDPADAARYGLVSGARFAGVTDYKSVISSGGPAGLPVGSREIFLRRIPGRRTLFTACRSMNKSSGKSAPRIPLRARFILSACKAKQESSFVPNIYLTAAAGSTDSCIICEIKSGGNSILGAKLFGIAAVLIAATSQLPVRLATAGVDFYTHDTYFVIAPRRAILGFALLWGVIAAFYYFGDRASGNRLNNGLTLAHFVLWIFVALLFFAVEFTLIRAVLSGHDPNQSRLTLAAGIASLGAFLTGALLFVVNLTRGMFRKHRASQFH